MDISQLFSFFRRSRAPSVFFLATIFSSFLAILRSSSSWPMVARDARRGEGRKGGSLASGA